MRTNLIGLGLALGLAVSFSSNIFADLLDEEEPAVGKPAGKVPEDDATKPALPTPSSQAVKPGKSPPVTAPGTEKLDKKDLAVPGKAGDQTMTRSVPPKNPGKKPASRAQEPVHFDSKGLKGLREKGMIELTQDVVVTQGEMRMEADHAEVFFEEKAKGAKGPSGVIKVVAEGNVKIAGVDENSGDRFKAFGNQAVFLNRERKVMLDGNARLWRGDDSVIRSKKITYEIDSGWIHADRVAGELAPGDKGK